MKLWLVYTCERLWNFIVFTFISSLWYLLCNFSPFLIACHIYGGEVGWARGRGLTMMMTVDGNDGKILTSAYSPRAFSREVKVTGYFKVLHLYGWKGVISIISEIANLQLDCKIGTWLGIWLPHSPRSKYLVWVVAFHTSVYLWESDVFGLYISPMNFNSTITFKRKSAAASSFIEDFFDQS